ncbi:type II toxin-antitoxin system RatA family toxin [Rhodococcus sp. NPDC003318]|uniref:type II toxin-antitoxin system RatA family toxin n=1 Tax=Rhodococcus sp. NPDC003318 TaxID=3364503 RepID=UPI003685B24C
MRTVTLAVVSRGCDADEAYRRVSDFERYPQLVDEVRSITVQESTGGVTASDWEVFFRNGPLRWSEVDYFQPEIRRITFEQTAGYFEVFRGNWQVDPVRDGCVVNFEVTFDFGIPSLVGVLEPIATKVLKEGIALALLQLLGDAEVENDPLVSGAVAAKLAELSLAETAATPAGPARRPDARTESDARWTM